MASRVELVDIELMELHFSMPESLNGSDGDWRIGTEWFFESAEGSDEGQLETRINFTWLIEPESGDGLIASFQLVYAVARSSDLIESDMDQFIHWNAVFNAWPYFRELVHNITARTRIGPTIAPVFKMPAMQTEPAST